MSKVVDLLQHRLLLMREAGALYRSSNEMRRVLRELLTHIHADVGFGPATIKAEAALANADALAKQLGEEK